MPARRQAARTRLQASGWVVGANEQRPTSKSRDARVLTLVEVGPGLGRLPTVIMFGNNFGLFRSRKAAARAVAPVTGDDGGRRLEGC